MTPPLPPPTLLTQAEAQAILEPHIEDLRSCLRAGWTRWQQLSDVAADFTARTSNRTRAGIVYDAVVADAQALFRNKPGVHLTRELGFLVVVFDGRLVVRFKKYRHGFRTSNIPTGQQLAFEMQAELDGMPPAATKAVVGYLLNKLQDDFARMAVTCRVGPDLVWVIEIPDVSAAAPTAIPLPPDAEGPGRPIVRPAVQIVRAEEKRD